MNSVDKKLMIHQRRILGILCTVLAPLCVIFGLFGVTKYNCPEWWYSISATYYANSRMFMIGLLFATAVYFFAYAGYDWIDRTLSLIAAVCALGVVAFPCSTPAAGAYEGLFCLPISVSSTIHLIFAATLFTVFILMVITFMRSKPSTIVNPKKKLRNKIYLVCAILMGLFYVWHIVVVLIGLPGWWGVVDEGMILIIFGVAYLVKGECVSFLNDDVRSISRI